MNVTPEYFQESMSKILYNATDVTQIPSIMLWGQMGIGKSASVYNMARLIEERAQKEGRDLKVVVTDIRLVLYNPVDLRGIPTSDVEKQFSIWLKPKVLDLDPSPNVLNILFMDELSAAPPSVQVCAYQITHDRRIGEHFLPKNTYPICAGNRTTDKSVAYEMSKALANRMVHFTFEADDLYKDWRNWALDNDIDKRIIAFLAYQRGAINTFDPKNKDLAFATPRSWENASKLLALFSDVKEAYNYIAGVVGEGPATEFLAYCEVYTKLPDIVDILNGEFKTQFNEPDILYAISTSLVIAAKTATKEQLDNIMKYVLEMRTDISVLTGRDLLRITSIVPQLVTLDSHKEWYKKVSKYIV